MTHSVRTLRRMVVGALALLVVGATSASAQTAASSAPPAAMQTTMPAMPPPGLLRLSDTITLRAGRCWLVSAAGDVERPPETRTPQRCVFRDASLATVTTGNRDDNIVFQYTINADGIITGKGREGMNQGAYSCTITGKTRPGTKPGGLMKAGAVIRVMEIPSLP